jgi:hypothetical protein
MIITLFSLRGEKAVSTKVGCVLFAGVQDKIVTFLISLSFFA